MPTLAKSFLWLTAAEFLFYASGYLVHMGAGRILGVEDYGRYTLVITITVLVANLIGAGLPVAMGKFLSASRGASEEAILAIRRKFARWQAWFLAALGGGFFLLANPLASALGDPTLAPLFALASLIIPAYGADLHYFHYYSGRKRFDVQAWLKTARSVLRVSVILSLAVWFHLAGMIAGYILVPACVFALAWAIDRWWLRKRFARENAGDASAETPDVSLSSAAKLAMHTVVFLAIFEVLMSFDLYVLKAVLGDDGIVGEYGAALTVARIPTFLFYALTVMLLPVISEAGAMKDAKRARDITGMVMKGLIIVSVPMAAVMAAFAEPILGIFFGAEFLGASGMLAVLGLATALLTPLFVLGFAFLGASRGDVPVRIGTSALLLHIVLAAFFISAAGALGAAWAKVFAGALVFVCILLALDRVFGARLRWHAALIPMLLGGILYGAFSLFPADLVGLFVIAPIGTAIYFLALFLLRVVTPRDFALFSR